ncbi:MAG TPA: S41 family peptidase [Pyrinomonadaceae bacterium]|jgi:C-terminal processing protease CtpA/Prc
MKVRKIVPSRALIIVLCCALFVSGAVQPAFAQDAKRLERERERGLQMLKGTKDLIKENYYDTGFHGIDLETRFKAAEEKMKQADSLGQIFGIIAQAVVELNDSHTYFVPPPRPVFIEYGWRMQMIGNDCYVIAVKQGSDAEAKGLKPGDMVLSVDGFKPTRETIWKMWYNYNLLRPTLGMRVVAQNPAGEQRQLDLKAEVVKTDRAVNITQIRNEILDDEEDEKNRPIFYEVNSDVIIWKLRAFNITEGKVDDLMKTVRKHKALILDLRGNGGGYVKTLARLVSYFFDKEINIAEVKRRKKTEQQKSRPRSADKVFTGNLTVLVDSQSGSAAEMFARVVQLEKRGTVIGDRTAGAVMQSLFHTAMVTDASSSNVVVFGVSITDAEVILSDGKVLEHVGVMPDELKLPVAADMSAGRDAVLSYAVALAGATLAPEKASQLFPYQWTRMPN